MIIETVERSPLEYVLGDFSNARIVQPRSIQESYRLSELVECLSRLEGVDANGNFVDLTNPEIGEKDSEIGGGIIQGQPFQRRKLHVGFRWDQWREKVGQRKSAEPRHGAHCVAKQCSRGPSWIER